jgi:hypothetical protein
VMTKTTIPKDTENGTIATSLDPPDPCIIAHRQPAWPLNEGVSTIQSCPKSHSDIMHSCAESPVSPLTCC